MDTRLLDFLNSHRVCVITTLLEDGSPHSAAMHYSHSIDPLVIYISTDQGSRKMQALDAQTKGSSSMVIGISEDEWISLQMSGTVHVVVDEEELAKAKEAHYPKHPNSQKYEDDPGTVFLAFTPTWWRYTDFNVKPPLKLSSED